MSEIVVRRIFEGSEIFIAYREDNDDVDGFGDSAQDALNDLYQQEKEIPNVNI